MDQHQDPLLADVLAFLQDSGMARATFGRLAVNDQNIVFDLEKGGRDIKRSTERRLRDFMAANAPSRKGAA